MQHHMRERIAILSLAEHADGFYWQEDTTIWASAKIENKTNPFSKIGLGMPSVTFTLRKRQLTLHQAFLFRGQHCFLTAITENADRLYLTVSAAMVTPVICHAVQEVVAFDAQYNRPLRGQTKTVVFPAVLTEKYVGFKQAEPQGISTTTYVLVTPKAVPLSLGELVQVDNTPYRLQVQHGLDSYKNEYEMTREEDI